MKPSNRLPLLSSPLYPASLRGLIKCAASSLAPVFISGEKGTRKRALARAVHQEGLQAGMPFITVNAGRFDEEMASLLRDGRELKGTLHISGADLLPRAAQGTLYDYLDSGELSCGGIAQTAALRIIMTSELTPAMLAAESLLEETLLQRLSIIELDLPPLRDRTGDIAAITAYLRDQLCRNYRLPDKEVSSETLRGLMHRDWSGNIDELEGIVGKVLAVSPDGMVVPWQEPSDTTSQSSGVGESGVVELRKGRETAGSKLEVSGSRTPELRSSPSSPALRLAHDIKNPLVSIKTYANLLEDRFDDREFRQEFYQVMKKDVEKINRVVEEILSEETGRQPDTPGKIAVEEAEDRSAADINAIIERLLGELREDLAKRKIAVFKYLSNEVAGIPVENGQFRTALGGILLTILANTPDGGDIYISTARRSAAGGRSGNQHLVEISIEGSPVEGGLGRLQDEIAWQEKAMKSQGAEVSLRESESGGVSATVTVQPQPVV